MKLFKKDNNVITLGQGAITIDGNLVFNPTEKMLLDNGYVEILPTEETLEHAKELMKKLISMYDSSTEVNVFYYNDLPMWLDRETRTSLSYSTNIEKSAGLTETSLYYEGLSLSLPVDSMLQMLGAIELYAKECYRVTQSHIQNINLLQTIDEVKNYNYKEGYPDKIRL